jgi:hypothetical protein
MSTWGEVKIVVDAVDDGRRGDQGIHVTSSEGS